MKFWMSTLMEIARANDLAVDGVDSSLHTIPFADVVVLC